MRSYAEAAREVAAVLDNKTDAYLFHEHLTAHHEPMYVTDFVDAAAASGLRFLAEAEVSQRFDHDLPDAARECLARLGDDVLAREQLLDFLRGRLFRATLLVRDDTPVDRAWAPDRLAGLWLRTALRPLADGQYHLDRRGLGFDDGVPPMLRRLVEAVPAALPAADVVASPSDGLVALDLVSRGLVEVRALPAPWATDPGDRPVATPLARAQAREGDIVVALDHGTVRLDPAQRALVAAADGATRHPKRAVADLTRACLWRGDA